MRKISFLFIATIFSLSACQQTKTVDIEGETAKLAALFESYQNMVQNKVVDSMFTFLSDDVLVCGSDPTEYWTKEDLVKAWDGMIDDADTPESTVIGKPIIRVAPDGNSAIIVQQMNISFSPGIPWRSVYYYTKENGKWIITFYSHGLVPNNEDLEVISKAVAEKNQE